MVSLNVNLRVRKGTREKIDRIAQARRWSITETVDAIADHFLEHHEGELGSASLPSKGAAQRNSTGRRHSGGNQSSSPARKRGGNRARAGSSSSTPSA